MNPCLTPFSFTDEDQTNPAEYRYTGVDLDIPITPFTVTPARCTVTYSCSSVVLAGGVSNIDCDDLVYDDANKKFVFNGDTSKYTDGVAPWIPGTYTVNIDGTVDNSTGPTTDSSSFDIVLPDLCAPPTSITASTAADLAYTISDF